MIEPSTGIKVHLVEFDGTSDTCHKACTTHTWLYEGCPEDTEGGTAVRKRFYVGAEEDKWLILDAESSHIVLNSSKLISYYYRKKCS